MRAAGSAFSGFSSAPKKTSWDELSRDRETDGETKNYAVPPELIELARANRKGRGQVGTLTPLAPKPAQDVVVVVPTAAPISADLAPASAPQAAGSLQAPSVPAPEGAGYEPDSARTGVYAAGHAELAMSEPAESSPRAQPPVVATSPLAEMMRAQLAAAAGDGSPQASQVSASVRPGSEQAAASKPASARRSSRRARRSSRVEIPVEASIAARAAAAAPAPRAQGYVGYATGAVLVGAYLVLCYYANALLSGLP